MYSVPGNVILLSSHVQLKMLSRWKKKTFKYVWLHSSLTFRQHPPPPNTHTHTQRAPKRTEERE